MDVRRILFVHAHPDDEAIETGATMAKYAHEGAHVALVTCTLGEEGEIVAPELAALGPQGRLGEYRIGELAAACAALGVDDHRFLGGAGRWRDSGMMGTPANDRPDCFWRADLEEAARELVAVVREVRPQVIVTYDARGFYGHPDHIKAHQVAWRAYETAGDPAYASGTPWRPRKFYATAIPRSVLAQAIERVRDADPGFTLPSSVDDLPFGVSDDEVTTQIDASAYLDAKLAAMRAHATQIRMADPFFALADNVGLAAFGVEYYTLLAGPRGPADGPRGRETDLFGGLGLP